MNNEEARELYGKSGINYSNIGSKEIARLVKLIKTELSNSNNELEMKLCMIRNNDIEYKEDGTIKNCYLMVNGAYFKRREAISFNTQGISGEEFIGFAGWAGTTNTEPFIKAFETWIREIM